MDEQDVIYAFVRHLRDRKDDQTLHVNRWPDTENRTEPEIDAIAGDFAIEHTSIDSVANQRQRDDWYLRVVKDLDQVIRDSVDCGLTITLDFDAIGKGMDWGGIRANLQNWIVESAASLGNGNHKIVLPTSSPTEFPIVMHVWKGPTPLVVGFARFKPEDDTLPARIRNLLDRKAKKLRRYEAPFRTVMLVENSDIALMNACKMLGALRKAYPDELPQGVDEIWFADTSLLEKPQFHDFTTDMRKNDQ